MIHLIYIGSSVGTPSEQDLIELLDQARCKNWKLNVTGMLLYDCNTYLQVLEGDKKDVYRVYNSIRYDQRVERLITLVDEEITHRDFPDWSMGFKNLESQTPKELLGFSEIFSGNIDPQIAARKAELAVELIMSFSKEAETLRPVLSAYPG